MKITHLLYSVIFFSCAGSTATACPSPDNRTEVIVNPDKSYQTLEGWGSSLCWWAAQVGNWDDGKVDEIVDFITSPDYLNMNIFRYNIGGGDDPSHADGHMVKGKGKRAEMEGFKASAEAPYNWDADKAQRKILLKIKEKRPDAIFEAFSNSAPYWMTYSGCAAGHKDPNKDNLKPEYHNMFCDYLIDVCRHYKDNYQIDFRTLEPFNESYSDYWYDHGSQEGCHFEPATQITMIRLLYDKLQASGLSTVISASDETNLKHTLTVQKAYEEAGDIWDKIGQLNTHTYSGTNEERAEVRQVIKRSGKPFWQSETGPSAGQGLVSNLLLTQKMFDDLTIMQPIAWLDWQLMEEWNNEWCVFRGNFKTGEYKLIKNFYVRMQITRFFKQGYTFIDDNNEHTLAAISPSGKELVVAVLNSSDKEEALHLTFNLNGRKIKSIQNWRTGKEEDCRLFEPVRFRKAGFDYVSPAQSLTTFVVQIK